MAIIENSILRRKLGGYIIYHRYGKTYIRSKPTRRTRPFSPGQITQQEKISSVALLYQAIKHAGLYPIWQQAVQQSRLSGYNRFVQRNLAAFTGEGVISDFEKIHLSCGTLSLPDRMSLAEDENGDRIITWQNSPETPDSRPNDRLCVALMKHNEVYSVEIAEIGNILRKECRAVISLSGKLDNYFHLYCYFCSVTNKKFSESRYFNLKKDTL